LTGRRRNRIHRRRGCHQV